MLGVPCKDHPELTALLAKAKAAYEAMTPEQKREMHKAQRRSWVIGEMGMQYPDKSREEIAALVDSVLF